MSINSPHLRAGRLRHRAELQGQTQTDDGSGGWDTEWQTERALWCWIRPVSGSQRLESMRLDSRVSHEIFARFNDDLTTDKRIIYEGKAYHIEALWSPDLRGEYVHMIASEGRAT